MLIIAKFPSNTLFVVVVFWVSGDNSRRSLRYHNDGVPSAKKELLTSKFFLFADDDELITFLPNNWFSIYFRTMQHVNIDEMVILKWFVFR